MEKLSGLEIKECILGEAKLKQKVFKFMKIFGKLWWNYGRRIGKR